MNEPRFEEGRHRDRAGAQPPKPAGDTAPAEGPPNPPPRGMPVGRSGDIGNAASTSAPGSGNASPSNGAPAAIAPGSSEAPGIDQPSRAGLGTPEPRTARIIALANQKGGVGKTTTAISLGAALAELERDVLLVDFDPQGGCSLGLGIEPGGLDLSIYDALLDRNLRVEDAVLKTSVPRLELLPSNIDLAAAELMLVQEVAREQTLLRLLAPLRLKYDFILIDCPPSLGLLTINALTAADGVVVPLECEYYALRGMALLMDSIDRIRERLNPRLRIDGILATMFDGRTLHGREVLERVREAFGDSLFESVIRKTVRFAEAPVAGEPILTYAPTSPGAVSYRNLAREVMSRVAPRQAAGS